MAITDETIEYVAALAKLDLTDEEKETTDSVTVNEYYRKQWMETADVRFTAAVAMQVRIA